MGCNSSTSKMDGFSPLSAKDKVLVKESWQEFSSRRTLADLGTPMFVKLFADYPDTKTLFSFLTEGGGSPKSPAFRNHAENVMGVVGTAVSGIDDLNSLHPVVKTLGAKHYTYGAQTSHLGPVGECLLFAMESELKDNLTNDIKSAWLHFYTFISKAFQEGLEEEGRKQG